MSDDDTIKRRALDISALRDEDEGTEELDRYALMKSIQSDAVVDEDTRRTQKVKPVSREQAGLPMDMPAVSEEEVQDTANFAIPDVLLAQLQDSGETRPTLEPIETLEVEFESLEDSQVYEKTHHRTVEFEAFVSPDGSVSIPNQLLANRTIRPGQKLRIVAQPIDE